MSKDENIQDESLHRAPTTCYTPGVDYDPKLKKAMEEIKAILKNYDIGGAITLVSKTHSEYLYDLPTWSCVAFTDRGLSIYSQERHFKSKNEQKENQEVSFHVFYQIRDIAAQTFMIFEECTKAIKQNANVEHQSFYNFTPHQERKSK